jgi:sulfatase maturation enzyme AslB (radical SAM superfamily)
MKTMKTMKKSAKTKVKQSSNKRGHVDVDRCCVDCEAYDDIWGQCRFHAPRPSIQKSDAAVRDSGMRVVWSHVDEDDWCFEFVPPGGGK